MVEFLNDPNILQLKEIEGDKTQIIKSQNELITYKLCYSSVAATGRVRHRIHFNRTPGFKFLLNLYILIHVMATAIVLRALSHGFPQA